MSLLESLRAERHQFGRIPGDRATWSINDPEAAVRLAKSSPFVAIDIETGSAKTAARYTIKAFSIGTPVQSHVLDPALHPDAIRDAVTAAKVLVLHNAAYDCPIMHDAGLMPLDAFGKVHDTLVSARLGWPSEGGTWRNDLGSLSDRALGDGYREQKKSLEAGFKDIFPRMAAEDMWNALDLRVSRSYAAYSCYDTVLTARLYAAMGGALADALNPGLPGFAPADAQRLDDREQTVNRMLLRTSAAGFRLDDVQADLLVDELRTAIAVGGRELARHGIDPEAGAEAVKRQVLALLDAQGVIPASWPRLKNGSLSTQRKWMERLEEHPMLVAALDVIRAERWIKDYRDAPTKFVRGGRIHPEVSVLAARTGRMSYSRPPLQQYPGAVRRMFAFDRPAVSFDWASIEPVVVANLMGATGMLERFEGGGDIYEPVAEAGGVVRKTAKMVLLAAFYGQGAPELALRLGVDEDRARALQRSVMGAVPEISAGIRRVRAYGDRYGAVQTISGRSVPLDVDPRSGGRTYFGYKAINYLTQGSAYDVLAECLYAMDRRGLGGSLFLAIHDEICCAEDAADEVEQIMTTPPAALVEASGRVPVLRVGRTYLGMNWMDK